MLKNFLKVIKTEIGQNVVSIILGIGLASLFRKACQEKRCLKFKAPALSSVKNNTFEHNQKCYKFRERTTTCDSKLKTVNFA